jgi:hypothetical protein
MGSLTGQSIPDSYDQLLTLPSGGGSTTNLVAVTDGDEETTFALKLATTSISIDATDKFYLDGGDNTYIVESSADEIDLVCGGDILLSVGNEAGAGDDFVQVPTNTRLVIGGVAGQSSDTYFIENPDDTLQLKVGGGFMMLWDQDHQDTVGGYGEISCGINGTGVDFKIFGDTANQYMLWDQSADSLKVAGSFAASGPSATFVTFSDGDGTPSVSSGNLFKHHASTETITMFDDGVIGQIITVISTAAITYDVTSTNLKGGSTDLVTANGESTVWVFDGTNWYLIGYMDLSQNYNVDGV